MKKEKPGTWKLPLLLLLLLLTNSAGEIEGYRSLEEAICEECEKELTGGISFFPVVAEVFQALQSTKPDQATKVAALFDGGSSNADWSIISNPNPRIVQYTEMEPRDNTPETEIQLWGREDMRAFTSKFPAKLGVRATPRDEEKRKVSDSRWLTIYGRAPSLRWTGPWSAPSPTIRRGEEIQAQVVVRNSPSWREWEFSASAMIDAFDVRRTGGSFTIDKIAADRANVKISVPADFEPPHPEADLVWAEIEAVSYDGTGADEYRLSNYLHINFIGD